MIKTMKEFKYQSNGKIINEIQFKNYKFLEN